MTIGYRTDSERARDMRHIYVEEGITFSPAPATVGLEVKNYNTKYDRHTTPPAE